ncbi:hypothetical protein AA80_08575 [Petrotoga sibirica DSM 13575]|uniref:Integrase-like protein n=3 Tax=Petrotogaceae TaxID=1643949 RepID=A0A4R8EWV2_9BACT|nr:integrase core domain-containing protein [Petrotoga sibirica]POZ88109.1 hypothetical protein AA80_08575 [Petrotoga sibirica DSM 13575]POZ90199.1 hypothetical protein AD60_08705 [Petrotoga sp. SL27]TDX17214.1 integrase-like protein [Petrotoga sibirica]
MTSKDWERVIDYALLKANLLDKSKKSILITDNGTQPTSKSFKKYLKKLGIKHVRTAVRHPETNGRIEVFHKTLKYEHVYLKDHYPNILVARKEIDAFINYYNYRRLHQGIGFVTPEEMYTGKAEAISKYSLKERK